MLWTYFEQSLNKVWTFSSNYVQAHISLEHRSFFLPFAWAQSAATTFGGDVTLDFEAAVPESTSKAYEGMIMSIGDQYIPISWPSLEVRSLYSGV